MFQGAAQLNLDNKGRLAIPSRHRDMLLAHCAGQLVLTADADGCLLLYPQPEWQPIREKLMQLSAFNPRIRALQRFLVGHAEDVVMDAAGRVLISPTLRSYAVLDKRVMLIGQGNKFEVWDEARWQAQHEKLSAFSDGDLPVELEGFTL
ncbi:MAG: division/cell wall cluster transcriptional repressor MraZ [Nitrosomonadales bacterium]|nr:division/cell wall cluster transcriptional repressor MraZ [Nitrosomonadales bacterium]